MGFFKIHSAISEILTFIFFCCFSQNKHFFVFSVHFPTWIYVCFVALNVYTGEKRFGRFFQLGDLQKTQFFVFALFCLFLFILSTDLSTINGRICCTIRTRSKRKYMYTPQIVALYRKSRPPHASKCDNQTISGFCKRDKWFQPHDVRDGKKFWRFELLALCTWSYGESSTKRHQLCQRTHWNSKGDVSYSECLNTPSARAPPKERCAKLHQRNLETIQFKAKDLTSLTLRQFGPPPSTNHRKLWILLSFVLCFTCSNERVAFWGRRSKFRRCSQRRFPKKKPSSILFTDVTDLLWCGEQSSWLKTNKKKKCGMNQRLHLQSYVSFILRNLSLRNT